MYDPNLDMESSESTASGGSIHFMAPELLDPFSFGLDKYTPSKEGDIYAIAMIIYQVRTGRFRKNTRTKSSRLGTHRNTTVW